MNKNVEEEWKDIPGLEGFYQASNMGLIRSMDREVSQLSHKNYYTRKMKGQVIKSKLQNSGYEVVWLSKCGVVKAFTVHRLILTAFNPQCNIELDVNHIDGNKRNNKLKNLEWCSRSENIRHSHRFMDRKSRGNAIKCIETGQIFQSAAEASRSTGISCGSILHVIAGRNKTAGGHTWKLV